MRATFTLGRVAGIEIGIHYTWFIAFVLISWSLARGFYPHYSPGWAETTYWAAGVLSALMLFCSVLLHELAHSLVARAIGIRVKGITLFIFGGASNLEDEPNSPGNEFAVAIVGPVMSAGLALMLWLLYTAVSGSDGPLQAILAYAALVNGLLAVFNLLPGFPLDGGRVVRSIVWARTGSLRKATRVAAIGGQIFGWTLIMFGVFQALAGALVGGMWFAFIGWFLKSAAESSRAELEIQEMFRDVKVSDLLEPEPVTVSPDMSVEQMVRDYVLGRGIRAMPVTEEGRLIGIVSLTDTKRVPRERWPYVQVAEVMTRDPLYCVAPEDDLAAALALMAEHRIHQVLARKDGRLEGVLDRAQIIHYLQQKQELGLDSGK